MESSVEKGVWDLQDIMKYFGKSSTTVWHWRKKGYLPKPTFQMGQGPYWNSVEVIEFIRKGNQSTLPDGRDDRND